MNPTDARPPKQESLFGFEEEKSLSVIDALQRRKPTDKQQSAFRRLVAQIEEQRTLLRGWTDYLARHGQRLAAELLPLQEQYWQSRRRLVLRFDEILRQSPAPLGKRQRSLLQSLLIDMMRDLLQERPDGELEAIHDRHSELSHAEDREQEMAHSRDMLEDMLGIDLGDAHGATTIDALFARAERKMHAQSERQAAQREKRRAGRAKGGKAPEAEVRREQAAKEASQSVREVYRKLASALHPDRETDPAERQRRTEQMQRVNRAYEDGDLLGLLNIQIEIEQIDADDLAMLPEQRLNHYIGILREQLAELKAEIQTVSAPLHDIGHGVGVLTPESVEHALDADLAELGAAIRQVESDLDACTEPASLKALLKDIQTELRSRRANEMPMIDFGFFPSPSKNKKRRA